MHLIRTKSSIPFHSRFFYSFFTLHQSKAAIAAMTAEAAAKARLVNQSPTNQWRRLATHL
jgi:hypothetical protein